MQDSQQREFSKLIEQALTPAVRLRLYPKSQIDVFVQVLEGDGTMASLASAITCASLALADAGIEMVDLVGACSVAFGALDACGTNAVVMDCGAEEEEHAMGSMMLSYMPSVNEVTQMVQNGEVPVETLMQVTSARSYVFF
ncbi:Exosome complex component MTR3 [Irineochytrium annulatum]|nr:Exosome complex component MTR3 [Irineochytrium annulatum]